MKKHNMPPKQRRERHDADDDRLLDAAIARNKALVPTLAEKWVMADDKDFALLLSLGLTER